MPHLHFLPTLILILFTTTATTTKTSAAGAAPATTLPPDAVALLSFKASADLDNHLLYNTYTRFDYCQWQGVKCAQGRVVRYSLPSSSLRGTFPAATLSRLDQLRTLSLRNNSLSGPIPDLSALTNLKSLLLDRNHFSGTFPLSILLLHRLTLVDFSYNNLTGSIPENVTVLDRVTYLKLEFNYFSGQIPALNQTMLNVFNVSGNNLSGAIPVTPTMKRFGFSSFLCNPNLCGNVINKPCRDSPFFNSAAEAAPPPPPLLQQGLSVFSPPSEKKRHNKKVGLVLGFLTGFFILTAAVLSVVAFVRKRRDEKAEMIEEEEIPVSVSDTGKSEKEKGKSVFSEDGAKKERVQSVFSLGDDESVSVSNKLTNPDQSRIRVVKSGNLLFCSGEEGSYSLNQLMRASAELLGRGTIGTTYKAVMAHQLIVSVKRLDAGKTAVTSGEAFEQHMEKVGMLRHPNLVPVRAYFQAKQERLVIFDYQPNGSLFSLVHGSRSTRAKPLHWTSCLKIAEDIAQGLAYIHQASSFIHGNLKSSNVLLGSDFEACITDYCLSTLANISPDEDPDSLGYKAPEVRKLAHKATPKSDVYAFGVLLLELLTGKPPNQHPFLAPPDMPDWVRAMREDDDEDDTRLRMLVEVASICSLTSPEQRPTMWQVLKMITNIKEIMDDSSREVQNGYS